MASKTAVATKQAENEARKEAADILKDIANGLISVKQIIVIYQQSDGKFGFSANTGNTLTQVGMLETAKHVAMRGMVRR